MFSLEFGANSKLFLLLPVGLHFGGRVTFNDMPLHDDGILDVT